MAYYFYIKSGVNSFISPDQWQGFYPSIPILSQHTNDGNNSSFYAVPWLVTDLLNPNTSSIPAGNTRFSLETQVIHQKKPVYCEKSKRRAQKALEKQILSAKKNSQSNIINQFYSFFASRQKSQKIVLNCCSLMGKNSQNLQEIASFFYMFMNLINEKRGRKYVNRTMFLRFFSPKDLTSYLPQIIEKLQSCQALNLEQLCQIFRRCSKHFLQIISINAILTSKRISTVSKEMHLKKLRKFSGILSRFDS